MPYPAVPAPPILETFLLHYTATYSLAWPDRYFFFSVPPPTKLAVWSRETNCNPAVADFDRNLQLTWEAIELNFGCRKQYSNTQGGDTPAYCVLRSSSSVKMKVKGQPPKIADSQKSNCLLAGQESTSSFT